MTSFLVSDHRTSKHKEKSIKLIITDNGFLVYDDLDNPIITAEHITAAGKFSVIAYNTQTEQFHTTNYRVGLDWTEEK
jgi:hypothetical protein